MNKESVIELMDYNTLMSLINYFTEKLKDVKVHNKGISVFQSYSDMHMKYVSPSISIELLRRKNRPIGFNNFLYENIDGNKFLEFEGVFLEYMVQINVYSNTRGEIHKWCSILDEILKNGESGIPLNCYLDNGNLKQESVGVLDYNYSDTYNNNLVPNVITTDFHSIFEVKFTAIQQYKITYDIAEIGSINGNN